MKKKSFLKVLSTTLVTGALLASMTACGLTSNGSTTNASSKASSNSNSSSKQIKIGLSLDTLALERWNYDKKYFTAEAQKLGAKVIAQSANSDDAKQLQQAEQMINEGVNVLVVVPHDAKASAKIVDEAHAAGVKVLSYDRLIDNPKTDLYISFNNEKVGEMQASAITKLVPKGNYVYIGGSPTDNNAKMFKDGAMKVLQPLIDKGDIKLVYSQMTQNWDPANALKNMEQALTGTNNKVDAVVAANDGTAGGVIQALKAQGLAGKVPVSGQDADLEALQRIVAGTQSMTVYKPIKLEATTAAKEAIAMAKGKSINATDKVSGVPSILLTPIEVTKSNIDSTVIKDGFHTHKEIYGN